MKPHVQSFTRRPDAPLPLAVFCPAHKRRAEEVEDAEQDAPPGHLDKRARVSAGTSDELASTVTETPSPFAQRVQQHFAEAVRCADVPWVQRALHAGADVNRPLSTDAPTALHYVVQRPACFELLGTLMAATPNVQAGADNVGPLFLAVSAGNVLAVEVLLQAGADPHHACGRVTPYLLAASLREQSAARLQLYRAFLPYVAAEGAMQVDGGPVVVASDTSPSNLRPTT